MIADYTVLMSVYVRETPDNLRTAIQSMLGQTVPPKEFVIVCDGPLTPELDEVIEDCRARHPALFEVVRLAENGGLGTALSAGLKACTCDIVARMDSDDIAKADRMERQLAVLQERPDVSVVGGHIAEFMDGPEHVVGYRVVPLSPEAVRKRAAFRNPMNHVTTVFRKKDILEVGGYQSLIGFEDYHLWARLLHGGKLLLNLDEPVCFVRVSDGMYRRRGGPEYFKRAVEMERVLYEYGLAAWPQCVWNLLIRMVGTVLVPAPMRGILFQTLLRKRHAAK